MLRCTASVGCKRIASSAAALLAENDHRQPTETELRLFTLHLIQHQMEGMIIHAEPPMVFAYNRAMWAVAACIQALKKLGGQP